MKMTAMTLSALIFIQSSYAFAQHAHEHENHASGNTLSYHYNVFYVHSSSEGPRGRNAFAVPNMFMADYGSHFREGHRLGVHFMGTLERWTLPDDGYPLLLQVGEVNEDDEPYVDAQHPHSSPIMGLTFSDTLDLDGEKTLKVFFAPRGEATDGPIAFMHRPTGMVNPDAPLGHHVGQDVSHITSTVVGTALSLGPTTLEFSAFNGEEPEPTEVDLPIGELDSYAARVGHKFNLFHVMASAGRVRHSSEHHAEAERLWRYSASVYSDHAVGNGWKFSNAFIWGLVNGYDHTSSLASLNEEFLFRKEKKNIWGRVEYVQRTAAQLLISSSDETEWVTAATVGYTHALGSCAWGDLGLGASVTQNFLPSEFKDAYGGNPIAGKIFLQTSGGGTR